MVWVFMEGMMATTEGLAPSVQNPEQVEEWFLGQLERKDLRAADLLKVLRDLDAAGRGEQARACADLLQDAVRNPADVLSVLDLRAAWHTDEPAFVSDCERALAAAFEEDRMAQACLNNAGFAAGLDAPECLRRLKLLLALKPGVLCYDKTWGPGVVKAKDDFYQRVTIDFPKKSGHHMSLAYAAETLEILDDGHLLARKQRDPAGLKRLAEEDPAGLVKLALASFGPMTPVRLQEVLTAHVLAEAGWKKFWDEARKHLKSDPLVEFPSARTQPLRLLEQAPGYDAAWFRMLVEQRDPKRIVERVEALREDAGGAPLDAEQKAALGRQISFVIRGCIESQPDLAVRALLVAADFAVDPALVDVAGYTAQLAEPAAFLHCAHGLSVRTVKTFLRHLAGQDADRTATLLLETLPGMHMSVLNEAMEVLLAHERRDACAEVFRAQLAPARPRVEPMTWLARRLDLIESWGVVPPADFGGRLLDTLDAHHMGEELKARKQLLALFQDKDWLNRLVGAMDEPRRRDFIVRLRDTGVFPVADRQSLLARLIRLFPELHGALLAKAPAAEQPGARARGKFTSWRSLRKRQEQYGRLVNVEIPENSKEIAVARSYGDLSENHEYKAAKEMQGILLRRKGEFEQSLAEIQGTDFADFPKTAAGLGTMVTVRHADGRQARYCILGEWDSDESLGIIPCGSRVALLLDGHGPADRVALPGAQADEPVEIVEVADLPQPIKEWIA